MQRGSSLQIQVDNLTVILMKRDLMMKNGGRTQQWIRRNALREVLRDMTNRNIFHRAMISTVGRGQDS
jgi:hypothetical protein